MLNLVSVKKRDTRIDILRFLAMIGIIIAHSNPPSWLFELRNFDVTLIILMMGSSFYLSNHNKTEVGYVPYARKRFRRLIIPTWLFLSIFFILFYSISLLFNIDFNFSLGEVARSYLTVGGISFVWIMGIFFLVALFSPFILYISKRIKSTFLYFLVLLTGYGIYTFFIIIGNTFLSGSIYLLYEQTFLYGFGYILVAAIGVRFLAMSKNELIWLGSISFIVYLLFGLYMDFPSTQDFKNPPTLYYISYGVFISVGLYFLVSIEKVKNVMSNRFFMFISRNSLWLYFWHIIPVYLLRIYGEASVLKSSFLLEFSFVLFTSLLLTFMHNIIINKIKEQ